MRKKDFKKAMILVLFFCSQVAIAIPDGFDKVSMPGDGDCLYWSLTARLFDKEQMGRSKHKAHAKAMKKAILNALSSDQYDTELSLVLISENHRYQDKQAYLHALSTGALWPGDLELKVASDILHLPITVYFSNTSVTYGKTHEQGISLFYSNHHYNYLMPKQT